MKVNNIITVRLSLVLVILISLSGCRRSDGTPKTSQATGWTINDPNGGFKYSSNFRQQDAAPGLIPVEGGTFTMGRVQDDVMRDWNNTPTQQHVQSFYMDEHEVTNLMYSEYLYWLKYVFSPDEEAYQDIYKGALPDTLVWRNRLGYNETMTNNYLRHPAYAEYPVVGVNWIQAVEFCKWRTNRVNEQNLEDEGYLKRDSKTDDVSAEKTFDTETYVNAPTQVYGGDDDIVLKGRRNRLAQDGEAKNIYAQRSSGLIYPEYRLPTEAEWEYAAVANVGNREFNMYKGQKKYPWSGSFTRSSNRRMKGDQLANFKMGKGDYGGIAGWSDDGADITQKVKSYPPNDFGLYDMAGNVNEWVYDVYRQIVDDEVSDFNYVRGNVYLKNKIGEDGKVELVTIETMQRDTLPNAKIVVRSLPGQIAQVPIDKDDTYLRQNFTRSNNIDYRDGDSQSGRDYASSESESGAGKRMYNSPTHSVTSDSTGGLVKNYDKSDSRTSLVSNAVRVYKGGSWRDRAYWLDPAQRRYYPEYISTDDIGFRCAMSKVGPKSNKKTVKGNPKSK
jgi:gliding motility-associated lipoprotein GldJ